MRKTMYWVHTSIDGFIDGPNGEFDWPVIGPQLSAYSQALDDRVDTLLYRRPVWKWMVNLWPRAESLSKDSPRRRVRTVLARYPEDRSLA